MTRNRIGAALAALLALLLASCQTGPSAADVAADRVRWTAVRDYDASNQARLETVRSAVSDGVLSPAEVILLEDAFRTWDQFDPLYATFLATWDEKLVADEKAANAPRDPKAVLLELLRVYGMAAVQVVFGPQLQQKAPELFRLIDKNGNGVIEDTEVAAIDPTDPVFAIVVIDTVRQLLWRKR